MLKKPSFKRSEELFERAKKSIAAGTNSAARAIISTGLYEGIPIKYPKFMERASGSHVYDVDGNEYVDYHLAFGPVILGHCHPKVSEAVKEQLDKGVIFGMNTEAEVELCEKIVKHIPCAERVQIMNTGSAATTATLKIVRAYTGKEKVIRFEGHYHGWHDWDMFHRYPSGMLNRHGIVKSVMDDVIILPWNKQDIVEKTLKRLGHEIAAVICEPYQFNNGVIPPNEGYLEGLREITQEQDVVLVFDEVITGFRVGLGGAQKMLGVTPDIGTFGKAMANGFPISAIAGREDIMKPLTEGSVWIGGTFNANPICTVAALATVTELEKKDHYNHMYNICKQLMKGLRDGIENAGVEAIVQGPADEYHSGPGFSIFFTELEKITKYDELLAFKRHPHIIRSAIFYQEMVKRGILVAPYWYGRIYISASHDKEDANKFVEVAGEALKEAKIH